MKFIKYILSISFLLNINANAQILECRAIEDMKVGVQLAKYKFEKLKSANGTVYKRGGYNSKYEYTMFTAITELDIENIALFNESKYIDGIEMYKGISTTEFKNGMKKELELLCYDVIQMNKKIVKEGTKPSQLTVSDY